jgi:hypothetical protein
VNNAFGGGDDHAILGGKDDAALFSRIGSIMIKGQAFGSADGTGEFGFVAQQFGTVKVGGGTFALGSGQTTLQVGTTADLTLRQIA